MITVSLFVSAVRLQFKTDINKGSKSYSRQASLLDQYFQNEYLFIVGEPEVIRRVLTIKHFTECFFDQFRLCNAFLSNNTFLRRLRSNFYHVQNDFVRLLAVFLFVQMSERGIPCKFP